VQTPEGNLRTWARYRVESHESSFSVALPQSAEWIRARVGREVVTEVEQLPQTTGYHFQLPSRLGSGFVVVELEYLVRAPVAAAAWGPPRLVDGVIEETLWEVRVPSSRAVVGVPPGWTDENRWYWDRYVWKRRPWKTPPALVAWIGGPSARPPADDEIEDDGRGDYHGYLFGSPGSPSDLRPWIASRASLVAIFSGPVLALGLLLLYLRPTFRLSASVFLALVLAIATAVQPSVTVLGVQSAMMGVLFTLVAAATQRLVERPRRASPSFFGEPNNLAGTSLPGSSVNRLGGAGSDDSTAIRVRAPSTVDHAPAVPPSPDSASGRVSSRERG
jgi:hypothetical protein